MTGLGDGTLTRLEVVVADHPWPNILNRRGDSIARCPVEDSHSWPVAFVEAIGKRDVHRHIIEHDIFVVCADVIVRTSAKNRRNNATLIGRNFCSRIETLTV